MPKVGDWVFDTVALYTRMGQVTYVSYDGGLSVKWRNCLDAYHYPGYWAKDFRILTSEETTLLLLTQE